MLHSVCPQRKLPFQAMNLTQTAFQTSPSQSSCGQFDLSYNHSLVSVGVFHVSNDCLRFHTQHTVLFDIEWWTKGNSALLCESCCSVWSDICKRPWGQRENREERGNQKKKKKTQPGMCSKWLTTGKKGGWDKKSMDVKDGERIKSWLDGEGEVWAKRREWSS